jgi:hypothetical protein
VSHYLSNRRKKQEEHAYLKYSLFLPIALGGLIIYLSWQAKEQAHVLERVLVEAAGDQKLDAIPSVDFLANFLNASMILIAGVCLGIALLYISLERPFRKRK